MQSIYLVRMQNQMALEVKETEADKCMASRENCILDDSTWNFDIKLK